MSDKTITDWILGMRGGDPEAADRLWERFVGRVRSLARSRLSEGVRRKKDEDDVAQSVLFALWSGAQEGRLDGLKDRDELWRYLAVITCRKAANAARSVRNQEAGESAFGPGLDGAAGLGWLGESDGDLLATLDEAGRELVASLDPWLQEVVLLRFEGYSNEEIAARQGKSLRTIERYLKMARRSWEQSLGE